MKHDYSADKNSLRYNKNEIASARLPGSSGRERDQTSRFIDKYYATGKPKIEVVALPELTSGAKAENLINPSVLVIACTSFPEKYAKLISSRFFLLDFDDITNPDRKNSFQTHHVVSIRQFIEEAFENGAEIEKIIASCDGGRCRSAALAAALMLLFGQNDELPIWNNNAYKPNKLVFETLCKELNLGLSKGAIEARQRMSERAHSHSNNFLW